MRPRFSVEKVGIDAGGSALDVIARLPAWPPTLMPTVSAMAALSRTAVSVRLVIVASFYVLLAGWWCRRRRARLQRRPIRQLDADDAPDRPSVLHRLDDDGDLIADLERASRPASLRHAGGILRLERPVADLPGVVLRVETQNP